MANTDKRDLILDNLTTAFAAIATGSGYNFTVGEARRELKDYQQVPESSFPAVYVVGADEVRTNVTNEGYKSTMEIEIIGYVKHTDASDAPEVQRSISKLISDICKAAYVDITRGGRATFSEPARISHDKGLLAPYGACSVFLTVEYRGTFAAP